MAIKKREYPLLYHGTSVGWLSLNDPATGRPYGFEFGKTGFGETTDGIDVIWLTEDKEYAERMACRAYGKCLKRGPAKQFPNPNQPGPGRMVYPLMLRRGKLVKIDLREPFVNEDMLIRVKRGVKGFHKTRRERGFFVPPLRQARLLVSCPDHFARRKHGWLDWLALNLCLDNGSDKLEIGTTEKFRRIAEFCKHASIDVVVNPMTTHSSNGDLQTYRDGSHPDWMLFKLSTKATVNGVKKDIPIYRFVGPYGWVVKPR